MRVLDRQFPHPVLSYMSDDFPGEVFRYDLSVHPNESRDGYGFRATFSLSSPTLAEMIKEARASYVMHVEAPASRFRQRWVAADPNLQFEIALDDLHGEVQVNAFILAETPVESYESEEFHQDYRGHSFRIRTGDILAVARPTSFFPNRTAAPEGIFFIAPNPEPNPPNIAYSLNGPGVTILVRPEQFREYNSLQRYRQYRHALTSMTVLPVLTSMLHTLRRGDDDESNEAFEAQHDIYRGYKWYQVLTRRLNEMALGDWIIDDPLGAAHRLLEEPLKNALAELVELDRLVGQSGGDGDE